MSVWWTNPARLLRHFLQAAALALAVISFSATAANAVPAFAVQTGRNCAACHIGGFGPQLTPYGREFKLGGYTERAVSFNLPISAMAVASYLHTQKDQTTPPAAHFSRNDNAAIDQISLFLAGGVGSHFGGFVQGTYDGVAEGFHWDSLDLRAVTNLTLKGLNAVLGASVNNAPTVQDAFNTLPAWGFPYTGSALAPAPGAAPLVGSLAQNTIGLTTYAWINSEFYVEAGGYRSPSRSFLQHAGIDPFSPGDIRGVAPYGRAAYQKNFGDWNFEVGVFGMAANLYPVRDTSTGATDHYRDLGLDGSFQYFAANKDVFTINARYTDERQRLYASQALGLATNVNETLTDIRIDGSYYWRNRIGLTAGAFDTYGSADTLLYSGNRSAKPITQGLNLQIDDTFFGKGESPLGPRFNARVGLQYTAYLKFDGARQNFDGALRNASDNNTVRAFVWVAY
jgi:hypothetical protein